MPSELRRPGQDPEAMKARSAPRSKAVEAIDVEAITRQALAGGRSGVIERSLAAAEAGMRRAEAAIDAPTATMTMITTSISTTTTKTELEAARGDPA